MKERVCESPSFESSTERTSEGSTKDLVEVGRGMAEDVVSERAIVCLLIERSAQRKPRLIQHNAPD